MQPDGRIVVAGSGGVVRLLAGGSFDLTFGYNGTAGIDYGRVTLSSVVVQADGRILIAGASEQNSTNRFVSWVKRYLPTGAADTSFGSGGIVIVPDVGGFGSMAVHGDGVILAGGDAVVRRAG